MINKRRLIVVCWSRSEIVLLLSRLADVRLSTHASDVRLSFAVKRPRRLEILILSSVTPSCFLHVYIRRIRPKRLVS